jgi:hypothetical protein
MLMADTMAIFFVILGFLMAFPALWLLCRGLWPRVVANAAASCRRGLIRPFLVGVPVTALAILATAVVGGLGTPGKIGGGILICIYLMIANCGIAGLATVIGERLPSRVDAGQEWRMALRGSLVLELSYLPPILGWFGILPLSLIIGCGAMVDGLLRRNTAEGNKPAHEYHLSDSIGAEQ